MAVTFNGEMYNDNELRQRLAREFGYRPSSTGDTELIPAGYLAWGEAFFDMIEGMFAVCLWDSRTRCLLLKRDGAGIKPLFVSQPAAEEVRFATRSAVRPIRWVKHSAASGRPPGTPPIRRTKGQLVS